jgi:hypothetical protein
MPSLKKRGDMSDSVPVKESDPDIAAPAVAGSKPQNTNGRVIGKVFKRRDEIMVGSSFMVVIPIGAAIAVPV